MCGIAGYIDFSHTLDESTLHRMTASLDHRGPDDRGHSFINDANARVGLGHTRLSIQDLSGAGHQPMSFGPLSIVYNGEVYNFRELRAELEKLGHKFKSDGDTEVILHAFSEWGADCLRRFIGMFAFVLHDASTRRLFLVRDRAGVKPLYVHTGRDFWLFGSELKALRSCSEFPARLSISDLHAYFRHGHVPSNGCIYQECYKIDGGQYWMLDLESRAHRKVQWWDQTALHDRPRSTITYGDASDQLEELLHSACNYRMVSDVPVGVFLSGGYDSTAIAAILQSQARAPIKTFTIGFTEGNDEAPFARETARILGADHHELYCSPKEAIECVASLPDVYDEPFADSSAIPTLMVSRLARQSVKVALSADGGDELFCGYNSYLQTARRASSLARIPRGLRRATGNLLQFTGRSVPSAAHGLRHKLHGLGSALHSNDVTMAQRLHGNAFLMPQSLVDKLIPGALGMDSSFKDRDWSQETQPIEAAMGLSYQTYLKDDILTKVDRATMAFGLEGREPLLDHRIAEFAASLPLEYKLDGMITKRILKSVVHRYVPKEMMDRPKSGFSLPIVDWMRNDLKGICEELCSKEALSQSGVVDVLTAREYLSAFYAGKFHYSPLIWRLFSFQSWYRRWGS